MMKKKQNKNKIPQQISKKKVESKKKLYISVLLTELFSILWIKDPHSCQQQIPQIRASLVFQMVKNLLAVQSIQVQSLGQKDHLEKEMETHSSIFAWRISWTEEPCGLQSIGLQKRWTRLNDEHFSLSRKLCSQPW